MSKEVEYIGGYLRPLRKDLKLSDRTFVCKDCGLEIDRDLNAAINIQAVGVDAAIRTQSSRVAGCVEASKME